MTYETTPIKFRMTVNDVNGREVNKSAFDSDSPVDNFIDEQCLHFEENFVNTDQFDANILHDFDQLNERFDKKLQESEIFIESQPSIEPLICEKCGHNILRL